MRKLLLLPVGFFLGATSYSDHNTVLSKFLCSNTRVPANQTTLTKTFRLSLDPALFPKKFISHAYFGRSTFHTMLINDDLLKLWTINGVSSKVSMFSMSGELLAYQYDHWGAGLRLSPLEKHCDWQKICEVDFVVELSFPMTTQETIFQWQTEIWLGTELGYPRTRIGSYRNEQKLDKAVQILEK